jgi:hypothetical protein
VISHRYAATVCVLLALALVPTIIHSYSGAVSRDGRRTAAIPPVLSGYVSVPSGRNQTWGQRRFESDDWTERNYAAGADTVRLTVVRTYDPKSVYHHPELAVAYGTSFAGLSTHTIDHGGAPIPVHVLKPAAGVTATGLYALHYDTRFVDDPIAFQVRTAGELLFSPRKPMTLFFALDQQPRDTGAVDQSVAMKVLMAAIDAFLAQTPSR